MAKSKGRLLAELLASDGKVKESKSALDIAGGKLSPSDIPTLPNSKLENSSISIAGHNTALGGSVTLNTGDIDEHTNYKYYTEARVRSAISASGDLSYNSTTGVISFSASASPVISVNSETGSVVLDTGDIAENGNLYHTTARARASISATGSLAYNSTTGVMSFTMPAQNTSNITEGSNKYYTDARVGSYLSTNGYATQSTIVGAITDSAPATLDTLNELAAALGDDANFSTTVTNSIATKLPLAGGTLTGALNAGGGINGLTLSNGISGNNFNITGVNQLTINDPGEGIVFGGGSTTMSLAIVDDATDRILRYSGTGAVFDVQGNITLTGTVTATGGNSTNWNTAYGWGNHASAGYVTSSGNTVIGTDTDLSFSGANVLSTIALTDGVITSYTNRVLTLANLGYTGETNATADQTAAEILTAIKTVDGSGSGLDADTLDGKQGSDLFNFGYAYSSNTLSRAVGSGAQWYKVASFSGGVKHITMKVHSSGDNTNGADVFFISCGSYGMKAQIVRMPSTKYNGTKLQEVRTKYVSGATYEIWVKVASITTSVGYLQVFMNDSGVTSSLSAGTEPSVGTADATLPFDASDRINYSLQATSKIEAMGGFVVDGSTVWHAGNDGSGSGLDADTLDGVNSGSFLRSDAADTSSATYIYSRTSTTPVFDISGHSGASNYNYFMRAGNDGGNKAVHFVNGSTRTADHGANAYVIRNDGGIFVLGTTNYATKIYGNGDLTYNDNEVWHAGNDGSGSGLDADLLDGQQLSYVMNYDNLSNKPTNIGNSDTVDGIHAASFLRSDTADTGSGKITLTAAEGLEVFGIRGRAVGSQSGDFIQMYERVSIGYPSGWGAGGANSAPTQGLTTHGGAMFNTGNVSGAPLTFNGNTIWRADNDGSGSGLDADLLDGMDSTRFISGTGTTGTTVHTVSNWNSPTKSGWYSDDAASNKWSTANWSSIMHVKLYDSNNNYASQLGFDTYNNNLYTRTNNNGTWTSWDKIWHAGVDGSGSGLDADLLDGQHGSYYYSPGNPPPGEADTLATVTGRGASTNTAITINNQLSTTNTIFARKDNVTNYTNAQVRLDSYGGSSSTAGLGFHISGSVGRHLFMNNSGDLFWNSTASKIWHASNDGSGSGLDADLLDGLDLHTGRNNDANKVVRTDVNGYIQAGWINTTSGSTTGTNRIYASNDGYIRYVTPATFISNLGLFTTSNDGSGSGLDADLLDGYHKADINPAHSHYRWTGIAASGTQARRFVIMRLYGCPAHWDSNWQDIHLKVWSESYEATNLKYQLTGDYGGAGTQANMFQLRLKDAGGSSEHGRFRLVLGTPVDAGWDHSGADTYYVDVYAEASHYMNFTVAADFYSAGFNVNTLPTSGGATSVVYSSPAVSNITTFAEAKEHSYFANHKIWNDGNHGSASGLDADLLDGQHGSYYRAYANLTGTPTIPSLSGYATETYVNNQITSLVDSSPAALNTLNELAAAIGDDSNFSTTVTNNIATKMPLAGGTFTGDVIVRSGNANAALHFRTGNDFVGIGFNRNVGTGAIFDSNINAFQMHIQNNKLEFETYNGSGGTVKDAAWVLDTSGNQSITGTMLVGGQYSNNSYSTVSSTRLLFGGGNDQANYHIGTNLENYGGNYTKLDLRWHTGIRMGAQANYGGIRFFNNEDLGSVLFSIGKGDTNMRVEGGNMLFTGDRLAIFGPNSGYSKELAIGGNGNLSTTTRASIGVTNGNLHIDSASGNATYLNFYDGTSGVAFGSGNTSAVAWMGPDGDLWKGSSDNSGSKYWHAGNDGSGSGLDADTVDGLHKDFLMHYKGQVSGDWDTIFSQTDGHMGVYQVTNTTGGGHSNYPTSAYSYGGVMSWQLADSTFKLYAPHIGQLFYQTGWNNDEYSGWRKIWDTGNDGSGSGLDADLLDGLHASSFLRLDSGSATPQVVPKDRIKRFSSQAAINTASGSQSSLEVYGNNGIGTDAFMTFHVENDYALYFGLDGGTNKLSVGGWSAGAASHEIYHAGNKPSLATLGFTGASNANYITNNNQLTNGAGYITASGNASTSHAVTGSAFATTGSPGSVLEYQQASGQTDTKLAPSTNWHNTIRMGHGNPYSYYSNTLAMQMTGTGSGQIRTQLISNNSAAGWRTVWDSSNDGSGSGLDADLLDGNHASAFLTAEADTLATVTGRGASTSTEIDFNNDIHVRNVVADNNYGEGMFGVYSSTRHQHVWSMGEAYKLNAAGTSVGNLYGLSYTHTNVGTGYGSNSATGLGHQLNGRANGTLQWALGEGIWSSVTGNVWGASNDGSGSGLDADTVDGLHASSFWRSDTSNNGAIRFNTTEYDFTSSYNPSQQGVPNSIRLWDHYTQTNAPATYGQLLDLYGRSGHWRHQFHMLGTDLRFRYGTYPLSTAGWSSWYTQWHSGNDGSGSGLDADTVRGSVPSFTDTNTNFPQTGQTWTLASGYSVAQGDWGLRNTTPSGWIQFGPANTSHAHIYTDRSNFYFNVNTMYQNGHILWAANNDGSGSGLDADTVDGVHASSFLTTSSTNASSLYIRNTSPTVYLRDTDHATSMLHCNSNIFYVLRGAADSVTWSQVGGKWPMELSLSSNSVTFGGNVTAYSDVSLKENIKPIGNSMDLFNQIDAKRFNWIDDGKKDIGFIAQDVQAAGLNEVVIEKENRDPGTGELLDTKLTLDYSRMVSVLWDVVKEQQATIDKLNQDMEDLKNKIK